MDQPDKPSGRRPLPSPSDIASQEQKQLFREWEEDYAARRAENANPTDLPSPGDIGRQKPPQAGNAAGRDRNQGDGRGR